MKYNLKHFQQDLKKHPWIIERFKGILQTILPPAYSVIVDSQEMSWGVLYVGFKNDTIILAFPEDRMIELGETLFQREVQHPGYYRSLMDKWKKIERTFLNYGKTIDECDFSKISSEEFRLLYKEFIAVCRKRWILSLTTTNVSYHADNVWIPRILKKYGPAGLAEFSVLSTSLQLSSVQEEEIKLLKLAGEIKREALDDLDEKLRQRLEKHAASYHWLQNNYSRGEKLPLSYFLKRIQEMKNPQQALLDFERKRTAFKKKYAALLNHLRFTKEERLAATMIGLATTFQDLRKKNNQIENYYILELLRQMSRNVDYSVQELGYMTFEEIDQVLQGKQVDKELLHQRRACYFRVFDAAGVQDVVGKKAEKMYRILDQWNALSGSIKEIKGLSACLGKSQGTGRIVPDAHNPGEFNTGDILIASMTRPEFLPLMKKAAAIVTDEGGITCHAAIISRELGIPCIIGTKVATKVFKDGDMVEVDADNGVVRKI